MAETTRPTMTDEERYVEKTNKHGKKYLWDNLTNSVCVRRVVPQPDVSTEAGSSAAPPVPSEIPAPVLTPVPAKPIKEVVKKPDTEPING